MKIRPTRVMEMAVKMSDVRAFFGAKMREIRDWKAVKRVCLQANAIVKPIVTMINRRI